VVTFDFVVLLLLATNRDGVLLSQLDAACVAFLFIEVGCRWPIDARSCASFTLGGRAAQYGFQMLARAWPFFKGASA
jgi:hypothetical protein